MSEPKVSVVPKDVSVLLRENVGADWRSEWGGAFIAASAAEREAMIASVRRAKVAICTRTCAYGSDDHCGTVGGCLAFRVAAVLPGESRKDPTE